ncbi:hypothetical protein ACEPPN_001720 [Leptodophora sp. 'Broadleaf-Isolate-01']
MEGIDEQTFLRFCEYAYMGDYTPAQQQHVLASFDFSGGDSPTPMDEFAELWTTPDLWRVIAAMIVGKSLNWLESQAIGFVET